MKQRPRRIAIGVGAGQHVVAIVAFVATRHRHRGVVGDGSGSAKGSGAMRAPMMPHLPGMKPGVRITGFVVDGAGLPVSGAVVQADLEQGAVDRALAPAKKGTGSASGTGSGAGSGPGTGTGTGSGSEQSYPTGTDGHFIVEGLVPGRYKLRVTGAGLLAAEVRFVPVPSDEARIVVARQISIDGTVTDGGKPVAAAIVGIRGDAIGGALEI